MTRGKWQKYFLARKIISQKFKDKKTQDTILQLLLLHTITITSTTALLLPGGCNKGHYVGQGGLCLGPIPILLAVATLALRRILLAATRSVAHPSDPDSMH